MKQILSVILLAISLNSFSQDATVQELKSEASRTSNKDAKDTTIKTWKVGGLFSANLAQASLSNWAAGGDKFSLSFNTLISGHAYYTKDKSTWDNDLNINYGIVKTTSLGTRKTDDRFDFLTKYGYALNKKLSVAALANLRSQFFEGYNYSDDGDTRELTSKGFAPAYLLLSPGLDFHPAANFSVFVSPATVRWVFINYQPLKALYGVDSGKSSRNEFGAYATINYKANLNKILTYAGRLDLFSNYKSQPQNVDVYMTNLFAAQISKILTVTYSLTLIYDDNIRQFGASGTAPGLQLQSLLGVGILVKSKY